MRQDALRPSMPAVVAEGVAADVAMGPAADPPPLLQVLRPALQTPWRAVKSHRHLSQLCKLSPKLPLDGVSQLLGEASEGRRGRLALGLLKATLVPVLGLARRGLLQVASSQSLRTWTLLPTALL